jgi:lipid-binding SYLF domain-containing protein
VQEARGNALEKLYTEKPGVRAESAEAIGYAVFSNVGVNLFLVSTQRGGGILNDNRVGRDIYMQMLSAGGGVGLGVKDFAAVFIFGTEAAITAFVENGWDLPAQADANLESNGKGEGTETATTVMPGTTLYQVADSGVAAQITLQGTKFWVDDELN